MDRHDARCGFCESFELTEQKTEVDDLEVHITSKCKTCNKVTKHLYNLELYETEGIG